MSTLTLIGTLTIGALVPALVDLSASVTGRLEPILAQLEARVGGYTQVAAKATLKPPSLTGNLDLMAKLITSLKANVQLKPPAVDFGIKAVTDIVAKLNAALSDLQALIDLGVTIEGVAGAAGVKVFVYEGPLADFSATLTGPGGIAAQGSVSGSLPLYMPLFVVDSGNGTTKAALKKIMAVA